MTAVFNLSPQPAYKKQYAETIHNNVTVNSSSSTTFTWIRERTVELNADATAWSNGTSGTATIQFTLTRIRPDGSEAGSVVGPIMSTLGSRKLRIELHASDSIKVSWTIAGGTTSYPVMKTTLGASAPGCLQRRLRTVERPSYMMAGTSAIAEGRPYWILDVSTDGDDQNGNFTNGYLDFSSFWDHDKKYSSKMVTGGFPSKMTFECEVSFGDSADTLDYNDPLDPDPTTANLYRWMGLGAVPGVSGPATVNFIGFRTYGTGVLQARAGTFGKDLVSLEAGKRYRLKVVVSSSQVEWHIDGMLKYAAPATGLGVVSQILRGDVSAQVASNQGILGGDDIFTTRPFYIYWIRAYSDDRDYLTFEEGIDRKISRVNSVGSTLIAGVAATQGLGTVSISTFPLYKRGAVRRATVAAAASNVAATIVQYRFVSGSLSGGTPSFPSSVRHSHRAPRAGNETVNNWGSLSYRTGGFGITGTPSWVGILGAQLSNAQGSNPTNLEITNRFDPMTWGTGSGYDVTTNDTDWRHMIWAEWEEWF